MRHSTSTPSKNAWIRSRPETGCSSANARTAGNTGAAGWMTVGKCVSSYSSTLAAAALRNAASSGSAPPLRPMTVAAGGPE
jgi:hypothetical protein